MHNEIGMEHRIAADMVSEDDRTERQDASSIRRYVACRYGLYEHAGSAGVSATRDWLPAPCGREAIVTMHAFLTHVDQHGHCTDDPFLLSLVPLVATYDFRACLLPP